MHGCSTPLISSPQGSPEMAKLHRSRSWKPRPRLPSNGRAAIASIGRRSSIRIGIPVASSPSSGTQPTSSLASNSAATLNTDQVGNFKYVWLVFGAADVDVFTKAVVSSCAKEGLGLIRAEQLLDIARRQRAGCQRPHTSEFQARRTVGLG